MFKAFPLYSLLVISPAEWKGSQLARENQKRWHDGPILALGSLLPLCLPPVDTDREVCDHRHLTIIISSSRVLLLWPDSAGAKLMSHLLRIFGFQRLHFYSPEYNSNVPLGFLPWEIRVAFLGESQQQKEGRQTTTKEERSTQMLMHAIAQRGIRTSKRVGTER